MSSAAAGLRARGARRRGGGGAGLGGVTWDHSRGGARGSLNVPTCGGGSPRPALGSQDSLSAGQGLGSEGRVGPHGGGAGAGGLSKSSPPRATRHLHLGLGHRQESRPFWHLAGVCSLVGLGRRGALASALHVNSGLKPGAWGEGQRGSCADPPGSQPRELSEEGWRGKVAGPRGAARNSPGPPVVPCSAWAGWLSWGLCGLLKPPAPRASGHAGAVAQPGPWLRAEASPW